MVQGQQHWSNAIVRVSRKCPQGNGYPQEIRTQTKVLQFLGLPSSPVGSHSFQPTKQLFIPKHQSKK